MVTLRKARISDVNAIHALLMEGAGKGLLLPRPLNQIYTRLRDFHIADADSGNPVAGCCALAIIWENMAEVRSLFVMEPLRGQDIGRRLVNSCLEEAALFGISRVFTLTYQTGFFARLGFTEVSKESLPQKIWTDCVHCPKFPNCDEVAMIINL